MQQRRSASSPAAGPNAALAAAEEAFGFGPAAQHPPLLPPHSPPSPVSEAEDEKGADEAAGAARPAGVRASRGSRAAASLPAGKTRHPARPASESVVRTKPDYWEQDSDALRCNNCNREFSLVVRKHHCRNCGGIFCDDCSDSRLPLPARNYHEPVRVCDRCFFLLRLRRPTADDDGGVGGSGGGGGGGTEGSGVGGSVGGERALREQVDSLEALTKALTLENRELLFRLSTLEELSRERDALVEQLLSQRDAHREEMLAAAGRIRALQEENERLAAAARAELAEAKTRAEQHAKEAAFLRSALELTEKEHKMRRRHQSGPEPQGHAHAHALAFAAPASEVTAAAAAAAAADDDDQARGVGNGRTTVAASSGEDAEMSESREANGAVAAAGAGGVGGVGAGGAGGSATLAAAAAAAAAAATALEGVLTPPDAAFHSHSFGQSTSFRLSPSAASPPSPLASHFGARLGAQGAQGGEAGAAQQVLSFSPLVDRGASDARFISRVGAATAAAAAAAAAVAAAAPATRSPQTPEVADASG
jgi:hypothetical protein